MARPILITGAGGLIGRATAARLAARHRIYGLEPVEPEQPLPGGAITVLHDLRRHEDPPLTEAPDTIIHLAQSPRYREFPQGASDVFEVNVGSTQRLLDWGRRQGVKRFILASTGSVYGTGDKVFAEDAPLPDSSDLGHYAASKRCGELIAEAYRGEMTVIILRFFFVYGPGQAASMLMPRLVNSVLTGQAIFLRGPDGDQLIPTYVDDAAAAIEAALDIETGATINVAGPQALSLREVGSLIGEAAGKAPIFQVQETPPKNLVGSTEKMRRLLVAPSIGFKEGLSRMMAADHAVTR